MRMTDLDDARSAAWFSRSAQDSDLDRTSFNYGFDAGARWAIRTSSQLSPHVAKFVELLVVLGFDQTEG